MATTELPKFKPSRPGKMIIVVMALILVGIVALFIQQSGVQPQ